MAQTFKETAHLHTDRKAYEEGWERIFGKKDSPTREINEPKDENKAEILPEGRVEDQPTK